MFAYGLDRYAASPEERFVVDGVGFLVPDVTSGVVPVRQLPELSRNFGLLAARGAGKSTTTAALAEVEPDAEYVETPLESRDKLERIIAQAADTQKPVYFGFPKPSSSISDSMNGTWKISPGSARE